MEVWQREYIRENQLELITEITCNLELLRYLTKCNVLTEMDVETLNVEESKKGMRSKADLLLGILKTRTNGYKVLVQALYYCKQSGPLLILLYGVQANVLNSNPFRFCDILLNTEEILSKNVLYQGVLLPLRDICASINCVQLRDIISQHLSVHTYKDLMDNKPVVLTINTVPDKKPYYIPRTLCMNNQLSPEIFQHETKGIFLIEGIQRPQLSRQLRRLFGPKDGESFTVESSNTQIYGLTSRFIVLEHHKDYDVIVQKSAGLSEQIRLQLGLMASHQPTFYWVHYTEGNYHYVKSTGGSAKGYIASANQVLIDQDQFIQNLVVGTTPTVLYDSAGMGKTVVLAEFARQVMTKEPTNTVLFLGLSEVVKRMSASNLTQSILNPDSIKLFLIDFITTTELGHVIMSHLLNTKTHKIYLFLDGFDEIDEMFMSLAKSFLQGLSQIPNFRVIITTRPHYSEKLENIFGILGYRILPFQTHDQVSFFLKFWESECNIDITDPIRSYAKECLQSFNVNISNTERQVAGIPLQCKMLAEIHASEAARGGNIVEIRYKLKSIYDMYDSYLSLKLSQFCDKSDIDKFYVFHVNVAFDLIFPTQQMQSVERPAEEVLYKVYKMGILEPSQYSDASTPGFVHRTFAEFLCAKHAGSKLCDNLTDPALKPLLPHFLLENIFKTPNSKFQNTVVVYFLNQFLEEKLSSINNAHLYTLINGTNFSSIHLFYSRLLASLDSNMLNVLIIVISMFMLSETMNLEHLKGNLQLQILRDYLDKSVLLTDSQFTEMINLAVRQSSIQIVKLVFNLVEAISGKHFTYFCSVERLLEEAVIASNFQAFDFLFVFRGSADINYSNLLNRCVRYSIDRPLHIIENKSQIVQLILLEYPDLVNNSINGRSPLLESEIHSKLVSTLLDHMTDPTECTEENENIAHRVARHYSSEEYDAFVRIMISRGFAKIFEVQNDEKQTPIHIALEKVRLTPDTWKLLADNCELNFSNDLDCSLFAHAITLKRNGAVLSDIETVGKIDQQSRYDDFVYLSAEKYNLEAMKYFVRAGGNVNKRHYFGLNTVLAKALVAEEQSEQMVQFLVEHGANVNAHFLSRCNCYERICCCVCITNPMQLAIQKNTTEVQNMLLSNGAKQCSCRSYCLTSCCNLLLLPFNCLRWTALCSCVCASSCILLANVLYGTKCGESFHRLCDKPADCCTNPCCNHTVISYTYFE